MVVVNKALTAEQLHGDVDQVVGFLEALQRVLPGHVPEELIDYLAHARDNPLSGEALLLVLTRGGPPGR